MTHASEIAAVILAGGRGSRMDYQDKPLLKLHNKPLIEHVISRVSDQVETLAISVNHNSHLYDYLKLPIIPDYGNPYAGPLVGIYSAMRYFDRKQHETGVKYLACLAADVPLFPGNIIKSLYENLSRTQSQVACCVCGNQIQPLFSLWRLDTIDSLESAISRGIFGPKLIFPDLITTMVEIPDNNRGYFLNINTQEALLRAEKLIGTNNFENN